MKNILILGAGYGGLSLLKKMNNEIKNNKVKVTLVDKNEYHSQMISLHELATRSLKQEDVTIEIKKIINKKVNFVQDEVIRIDTTLKKVFTKNNKLGYDILVIALGFSSNDFGIEGIDSYTLSLNGVNSSLKISEKIENEFINYSTKKDNKLRFIIAGLGLTGIELLAEFVELKKKYCKKYNIDEKLVEIYGLNRSENIISMFDKKQVDNAKKYLEENDVKLIFNTKIKKATESSYIYNDQVELKGNLLIWTAGVNGNKIISETFPEISQNSRVNVTSELKVQGMDDIYIIGDCASFIAKGEVKPYPPTAQIATQMGEYVGKNIIANMKNKKAKKFSYKYRGTICSLGGRNGIAISMGIKFNGYFALKMKKIIETVIIVKLTDLKTSFKKQRIIK